MAVQSAHVNVFQFMYETCYRCAVQFAMPAALYNKRREDREGFWCPNGHEQYYSGKTATQEHIEQLQADLAKKQREADEQRRQADEHRRMREWAETRAKGANIAAGKAKAKLRRTVERVNAGVCPHCQRTFKQLAAHMKCKHADEISA